MARFDLRRRAGGYLIDVQSNLITGLGTRLTVPLFDADSVPRAMRKLHPVFVEGRRHVMATHLMGAVPIVELGPAVGSLDDQYDTIVAAIDMIFNGF